MATPSGIQTGVGFRNAQVLLLDTNGIIKSTGTAAYTGIQMTGSRVLTINDPEPRQIIHQGDDSVFALDTLPPTEPMSGELRTAKQADVLDQALANVNAVTIGEASLFAIGTDQRGNEAQIALLAYRQAVDVDPASLTYGKRLWQFRLFPKCYVIPREVGFEDAPEERIYTLRPQFITAYPWGIALASATEGALRAQGFRGVAEFKPKIVSWVANGVTTQFTFPAANPAVTTAKIKAFLVSTAGVGVAWTPTTQTTQMLSTAAAPTTGTLVAFYEYQ